jgi:hypothetical protein
MVDVLSGHTATLLPGGSVLVAGGFGTTTQATAERYDPAANSWSPAGSLAEGRLNHTATVLPGGKVLVVGGVNSARGGSYLATAELYDPATNTWGPAGAMATARAEHTATLLPGGQVLVVAGRDGNSSHASAERYDPATNTWATAGTLAAARWLHTAEPLPSGQILVAGGRESNAAVANTERYDPAANRWVTDLPGQSVTVNLASQNSSGMTGTATLTDLGAGRTRVEISVTGAGAGRQPAHIHNGTCERLDPAPRFTLTPAVGGLSSTEIDAPLQEVLAELRAVHLHKSQEELAIYVACANLG